MVTVSVYFVIGEYCVGGGGGVELGKGGAYGVYVGLVSTPLQGEYRGYINVTEWGGEVVCEVQVEEVVCVGACVGEL
jgi:hypothetical protein